MTQDGLEARLQALDRAATPAPWMAQGWLYGTRCDAAFRPLGVAPHRAADSELIAAFRTSLPRCLELMAALRRPLLGPERPGAAATAMEMLAIFDAAGESGAYREELRVLAMAATPPPWDAGHLAYGMWIAQPEETADPAMIAADSDLVADVRQSVPALVAVADGIEALLRRHATRDGSVDDAARAQAERLLEALGPHDAEAFSRR